MATGKTTNQTVVVRIYGELFGGKYPSSEDTTEITTDADEIQNNNGITPVQGGVYYHPNLQFCAFDVSVGVLPGRQQRKTKQKEKHDKEGAEETAGAASAKAMTEATFLPYQTARALCEQAGFLFTVPIYTGSLQKCLAHKVRFDTTVPQRFKLKPIKNNLAEGIVIRPLSLPDRLLIKRKAPEFAETKYHQGKSEQKQRRRQHGRTERVSFTKEGRACQELWFEISARLQPARVASVVSKMGAPERLDLCAVKTRLLADVMEDLTVDGVACDATILKRLMLEIDAEAMKVVDSFVNAKKN
eukprot:CAMPEP_0185252722 /NCGR_PEP_ID=MMETSP1359-20130426/1731_1 /TAXON_ID=552665 /ORGANISM="Bigelowiella longifila, Strain CCMP242" /LENGTH=300 /DNA_ID=CAMNT_0027834963 /DNA_START=351 /DNA_END=1253 /DNA_ORIENTATION=-